MPELEPEESVFAEQDSSKGSSYYYRGESSPDQDIEKLKSLSEGHFGLNWAFFAAVGISVATNLAVRIADLSAIALPITIFSFCASALAVFFISLRPMKKIAFALNWSEARATTTSVMLGLNTVICCGAIGFVIVQQVTSNAMKKFGVHAGPLGLKKRDVEAKVQRMKAQEAPPESADGPTP